MNRRMIQVGLVILYVVVLFTISTSQTVNSNRGSSSQNPISLVGISKEQIIIHFNPPEGKSGVLEAELYTVEKKLLAKISHKHQGTPFEAALTAEVDEKDLANYYIRFRFDGGDTFEQRSLYYLGELLETMVLGQREFITGSQPVIRILVTDMASGNPVEGAEVSVELVHEENILSKFKARSDKNGEVAAVPDIPDTVLNNVKLKVNVIECIFKNSRV